jgi:hypothetical protein
MENDISKRLETLESKIDAVYVSTEKTRKYFLWTLILTVIMFVLPLIGLMFAVPMFLTNYVGALSGL